jgi:toxin ParE1/3/4
MARYVLSRAADADIEGIASYSIARWGLPRAERYILCLHEAFEILAQFPNLGRDAGHIRTGYRRFEHDRHSVFYRTTNQGVLIVRVLHHRQQPENYL